MPRVVVVDGLDLGVGGSLLLLALRGDPACDQVVVQPSPGLVAGALGDRDDAEVRALARPALDGPRDDLDVVRDLRDEHDVGAAGDARPEREPAGLVTHDLGDDDPMVAVRRAVQPVDRLGRDLERGREADRRVGLGDVVVDGLGQRDDVESGLDEAKRVLLRAAATDAQEGVEVVPLVGPDDLVGHVDDATVDPHPVRLVATRPEDRAADGQDAGERRRIEPHPPVLGQAAEAVAETDDAHPVLADRRLAEAADGGVEAGAVAPRGEDPDLASSTASCDRV